MKRRARTSRLPLCAAILLCILPAAPGRARAGEPRRALDITPEPIAPDPSVRWDYDIVYVRARRAGDEVHKRFYTDIAAPVFLEPGADLMLLHPDGSEELLVEGGAGAVTDPMVSFDGEWVYYTYIYTLEGAGQWQPPLRGADIFKIHVPTRRIVRLTNQRFTPNTGAADWASDHRNWSGSEGEKTHLSYGVLNMGPCPLPGGRLAFTSNRNAFRPPRGYPPIALQLFVIDDADASVAIDDPYPGNIEQIGHLNIAGALHPVVLTDGRVMFSSLESQGARSEILWGIWTIHPDGTRWAPLVSAFDPGSAPNAFHFQTQLSDGSIVIEGYYNQNNSGFGTLIKLPARPPTPAFGPARMSDPRHRPWHFGHGDDGRPRWYSMPFLPAGSESLTTFAHIHDGPADVSVFGDPKSARVGKLTHPSGAPDNHLLVVYSPGPTNHQYTYLPQLDGGIYLLKDGEPIDEPGELRLIKNDPRFNESWPRALVSYRRIYGADEPRRLAPLRNDGRLSKELPEGTPFGLVGSSSLYKRESFPDGAVPAGAVTASWAGRDDPWRGLDAFTSHGNGMPLNWHNQGADAGIYSNSDIHAVRIVAMEPTTDRNRGARSGRRFHSHARERLRILGEIPVRKFVSDAQLVDPDGNPDTSFLAKIPADTAFTFQTIDRRGMVLNMAQTWHQLRPGEVRTDCGGCHAHSQTPTDFAETAAGKEGYKVWNLTDRTPLVAAKELDDSHRQWDTDGETGLRTAGGRVVNVEYFRDVRPILLRSCAPCHTKSWDEPAGNLVLDADDETVEIPHTARVPGTYARLAADEEARFGHKPPTYDSWGYPNASRYIRRLQSRRSLLVWKIHGARLDGFSNDDHPSEPEPGAGYLVHRGERAGKEQRHWYDIDYVGDPMPPPAAIAGTFEGPGGRKIQVPPLSDEEKRTIVRWIDLGCPVDLDHDPERPYERGHGWMGDDLRPTLALAQPLPGRSLSLSRIVVGMVDAYTGIDLETFSVKTSFALDAAGSDLASRFRRSAPGVWTLELPEPITSLADGRIEVAVKDRQGNESRLVRTFAVGGLNPSTLIDPGPMPLRVHVFEDYETEIEKRWWMRGTAAADDVPPSLSLSVPNTLACRAGLTRDFDQDLGDPRTPWRAVIFNPVPGPPMGPRTRLRFRYKLAGTDSLRVQLYSLSNDYHRCLTLAGLEQGEWREAAVDMTAMRRPDGGGGPLAADERIDDIQFYVDSRAELLIDDIVLYEAAPEGETRQFPRRVIFTGWFDTGEQGEGREWPGDFEIVRHEPPRGWDAARSLESVERTRPWIRIHMRGARKLSAATELRFLHKLRGADAIRIALVDGASGREVASREIGGLATDAWAESTVAFDLAKGGEQDGAAPVADEIRFVVPAGAELLVDDVLLYEPGD